MRNSGRHGGAPAAGQTFYFAERTVELALPWLRRAALMPQPPPVRGQVWAQLYQCAAKLTFLGALKDVLQRGHSGGRSPGLEEAWQLACDEDYAFACAGLRCDRDGRNKKVDLKALKRDLATLHQQQCGSA